MNDFQTMPLRFRVWDVDKKKFVDYNEKTVFSIRQLARILEVLGLKWFVDCGGVIISQDTGLVDKNGTNIFTGDIIADNTGHYEVWYSVGEVKYRSHRGSMFPLYPSNTKVIGNIFENPELLEETEG